MRAGTRMHPCWPVSLKCDHWQEDTPLTNFDVATAWNGWGMSAGTCTIHTWNDSAADDEGDPPMGMSYTNKLEYSREFNDFRDSIREYYRFRNQPGLID